LVDPMDNPPVEPREEPLGTADRGVERHLLAGGVAVERDVHVVDPGAGHGDSFNDRLDRTTHRPTGMARLIAGASYATARQVPAVFHLPYLPPGNPTNKVRGPG